MWWEIIKYIALMALCMVCNVSGAYVGMRMAQRRNGSGIFLKYALAESELERLLLERDEARDALSCITAAVEGKGGQDTKSEPADRPTAYWIYDNPPDENDNLQAVCSHCYAGDTHAKSLREKVPFCWKCGARMGPGPTIYEEGEHE